MDKLEIIEQIKLAAKENKGRAPGQERFQKLTGIKQSDWYPYYWLRWSDALKDAGFAPNQLITAIDKTLILTKLIELIQELGRYPVAGELRIKAKQDSSFPSHTVFDRLGSKKKLASLVRAHCIQIQGLEGVAEICSQVIGSEEVNSDVDIVSTDVIEGFVYLMKHGRYYKIGRTDAIGRRHSELKIQMPEDLEIVHHFRTDDPSGIEAYWHKRFANKRKNGEWFDLNRTDINAFKLRKKFM